VLLLEAGGAEGTVEGGSFLDVVGTVIDDHVGSDGPDRLKLGDQLILFLGSFPGLVEHTLESFRLLDAPDAVLRQGRREFRPEIEIVFDDRDPLRDGLAKSHKISSCSLLLPFCISWHPPAPQNGSSAKSARGFIGTVPNQWERLVANPEARSGLA
jgi:hypothetical protein